MLSDDPLATSIALAERMADKAVLGYMKQTLWRENIAALMASACNSVQVFPTAKL